MKTQTKNRRSTKTLPSKKGNKSIKKINQKKVPIKNLAINHAWEDNDDDQAPTIVASLPHSNIPHKEKIPQKSEEKILLFDIKKEEIPLKVQTKVSKLLTGIGIIAFQIIYGSAGFVFTHKKLTEETQEAKHTETLTILAKQFRSKFEDGKYKIVDEISNINSTRYKMKVLIEKNSLETLSWNSFRVCASHNFTNFKAQLEILIETLNKEVDIFCNKLPELIEADKNLLTKTGVFEESSYKSADTYRNTFKVKLSHFTIANQDFQTTENLEVCKEAHFAKYQRVYDLMAKATESFSKFAKGEKKRFRIDSLSNIIEEIDSVQKQDIMEDNSFDEFCTKVKTFVENLKKSTNEMREETTKSAELEKAVNGLTSHTNNLKEMMDTFFA